MNELRRLLASAFISTGVVVILLKSFWQRAGNYSSRYRPTILSIRNRLNGGNQ